MLAQWISWAFREGFTAARREPLITLGSAPLHVPEFRGVVLGQLGEPRLGPAIDTDIAGANSHARALDADTKGPLRDIHRRVGATIFFESSGGQVDRMAHLPELRFALGEPEVDTTSIDNAALALEAKAYYLRRVGSDGFRIHYRPTLKKVVSDRRASLDLGSEVRPAMRKLVEEQFEKGASIPIVGCLSDGSSVADSPRLTLILMDPELQWTGSGPLREQVAEWTRRGSSDRLYPASLLWCFAKPGRELREKVETWLAWRRVADELERGQLGVEYDRAELADVRGALATAEEEAQDEVWAVYRYVVIADSKPVVEGQEPDGDEQGDGLKVIDLGAGHASARETLCGRVIAALKGAARLDESVGAGYIERHWPPALRESGAWPLTSLRQSFLNGALTRLLDPDTILRRKLLDFVEKGEFGLASGPNPDGTYQRVWFREPVDPAEVSFEAGIFLLTRAKAKALKTQPTSQPEEEIKPPPPETELNVDQTDGSDGDEGDGTVEPKTTRLVLSGDIPSEVWNRLGAKLLPKLRSGEALQIEVRFGVTVKSEVAAHLEAELRQVLQDLGLQDRVRVQRT
jgi:hypothetical protein